MSAGGVKIIMDFLDEQHPDRLADDLALYQAYTDLLGIALQMAAVHGDLGVRRAVASVRARETL